MKRDSLKIWRHSALRVLVALEILGEDPKPLLSRLGFTLEDLMTPGYCLDLKVFQRLLFEACVQVDRKDFCLYVGECVAPLGNSALNWAVALSETPIKALKRYAEFMAAINPSWRP